MPLCFGFLLAMNRIELNRIDSFVALNRIESFYFLPNRPSLFLYNVHWQTWFCREAVHYCLTLRCSQHTKGQWFKTTSCPSLFLLSSANVAFVHLNTHILQLIINQFLPLSRTYRYEDFAENCNISSSVPLSTHYM